MENRAERILLTMTIILLFFVIAIFSMWWKIIEKFDYTLKTEPQEVELSLDNYNFYLFCHYGFEVANEGHVITINFEGAKPNFFFVDTVVTLNWGPITDPKKHELQLTASGQGKTFYYEALGLEYTLFLVDIKGQVLIL